MAGRNGFVIMRPELWRATKDNILVEDVSSLVRDGFVEMDYQRDIKTIANFEVTDPDAFAPYTDYLAPFLELEFPDGSTERYQLGLFCFDPFEETWTATSKSARIDGKDLTYLLQQQMRSFTYELSSGTNVVTAAKSLLSSNGITRVNIPASTRTIPSGGWRRQGGTTLLKIANDLMNSIGYYTLFTDRYGVVTSFPFVTRANREPVKTYTGGNDGAVLEPFVHRLIERPYNHVVLVRELDGSTLVAKKENTNPANPTSIPNIGRKTYYARDDTAVDQASLNELAQEKLEEFGLLEVEADFYTMPEPWHEIHELYELDLRDKDGVPIPKGQGFFWATSWKLGMSPRSARMQHRIKRYISFPEAA